MFAVNALLQFDPAPVQASVLHILLAGALGMFLGLEREWSQKSAGVRTFALISLLAAVFTLTESQALLVVGGVLVIVQGILLAVQGLLDSEDGEGLSLTTSVSMLVAYGVGALVAEGFVLEGVAVAVFSSLLLVLKRELHSLAWGLSREELRSASEFAILAFVIYPLLPPGSYDIGTGDLMVEVEPRVIWLMVVTVAGIGIVNYAIVQTYGSRGIAVTGFFGGLASSTAVVGAMLDHVEQRPAVSSYAVAAILLADAAMAARNLVIALVFTFETGLLVGAVVPLGAVILGSVAIAAYTADWTENLDIDMDSPFSLRNVLSFGGLFLVVIVAVLDDAVRFGVGFVVVDALRGSAVGECCGDVDRVGFVVFVAFTSALGVEREQGRDDQHRQRDGCVAGDEAQQAQREDAQRDGAPEAKAVDVDRVAEPRRTEGRSQREGDADTRCRRGTDDQVEVRLYDEGRTVGGDARDEPECEDDRRSGEPVTEPCAGRPGGDSEDDQGGEALEDDEIQNAPNRRGEDCDDDRSEDDGAPHEEDRRRDRLRFAVHLGEDDGQRCRATEDEQADFDNTGDGSQPAGEDDGGEDPVEQRQHHHRREQSGRAADASLQSECDWVLGATHVRLGPALTRGRRALSAS